MRSGQINNLVKRRNQLASLVTPNDLEDNEKCIYSEQKSLHNTLTNANVNTVVVYGGSITKIVTVRIVMY